MRQECAELLTTANAVHRSSCRLMGISAVLGFGTVTVASAAVARGWPWPAHVFFVCALAGMLVDALLSWRRLRKCSRLRFHLQRIMARDSDWMRHWNDARRLCRQL